MDKRKLVLGLIGVIVGSIGFRTYQIIKEKNKEDENNMIDITNTADGAE